MRFAQISDRQAVVYWCSAGGELMLAPDTRMRPFRGWRRFECKTAGEIESFSRRMARQQYLRMRNESAGEHLRHAKRRDEIKANCRLRLAAGCISAEDERLTRQTLESIDRKERAFLHMLTTEPDLSRASLTIEQYEEPTIERMGNGKHRGLADEEINAVAALAGSTI